MPSRPPEIMYGICSNNRVVCAAPYHASNTRITPSGMRIDPTVSSVRSVTTKPVRRRSAVSRSDSDACAAGDAPSIGSRVMSAILARHLGRLEGTRRRDTVDDVVGHTPEPEAHQGGAEESEHRLPCDAFERRRDGLGDRGGA